MGSIHRIARTAAMALAVTLASAACADAPLPTGTSESASPSPGVTSIAPTDADRVLFDTRTSLQDAQSMQEALAAFGIDEEFRAHFGFTTDMDGAGTNALRIDWPSANGSCADISPSIGRSLPAPAPTRLAVTWKQRLGRTATGGGLGEVGSFDVFRSECGKAGRFVFFADRVGSSNRVEVKWGAPDPGTPNVRAKSTMNLTTANQGWTFLPQQHVGEVIEQTLYVRSESAKGARDGIIRLWVNDRLLVEVTGAATGPEAFSKFVLPWTAPAPLQDQSEYYWDVVAWEPATDVTGAGDPPPPPADTTTPPPPDTTTPPPAPVAHVGVTPATVSLQPAATAQLSAEARDAAGNVLVGRSFAWASSNPAIASVSSTGLVTGVAAGSATITATAEGRSGSSSVTVIRPEEPPPVPGSGWFVSPSGKSSNAGTSASPWDLQTALSGASGRIQPGDTVWIRGGVYPDGGKLTRGGTADAYITYSGHPGETAIIRKQFRGSASYVVIRDLVFEGPINGATNQVYLHDCHHVVFTRNEIRNGDFHAGLSVDESHHMTITYNYIHDNGVDASHDHGIYFKTTTGPGTVIANNLLVRNAARGLSLHDNSGDGVYDVVVAHNTVVGNGSTGILVNDGDRMTLVNNIVVGNGDRTGQRQIRIMAGNGNKVWNNLTWHPTASSRAGIENATSSEMSGNQVADPAFVEYPANLRLKAGSPAIGKGLPGWVFGHDYAGKARDGSPDVGAFEH